MSEQEREPKYYTEAEAAELLQIAEVTLRKHRYNGKAQYSKYGRLIRYSTDDIRATHELHNRKAA